jgi:hypothetical protein
VLIALLIVYNVQNAPPTCIQPLYSTDVKFDWHDQPHVKHYNHLFELNDKNTLDFKAVEKHVKQHRDSIFTIHVYKHAYPLFLGKFTRIPEAKTGKHTGIFFAYNPNLRYTS